MRKIKCSTLIILVLIAFLSSVYVLNTKASISTDLTTIKDAYVDEEYPNTNYGTDIQLQVRSGGSGRYHHSLIEFNVSSFPVLDPTSVTLKLYCSQNQVGRTYYIYRTTSSWTETTVTYNTLPSITSSYISASSPTSIGWWTITVTSLWVVGDGTIGFEIKDLGAGDYISVFVSKENATATYRPKLTVVFPDYTIVANYTFSAPKYENETSITCLNVTAHFESLEDLTFPVSASRTIFFCVTPLFFSWQVEIDHRIFYPRESGDTISLFVPDEPHYVYVFTVRDYAGIVDETAYLECYKIVGATKYLVDRDYVLGAINGVAIPMHYGGSYELVLNTSEYEYIFGWFLASSTLEQTLTVKSIDFPTNIKLTYIYITAYAYRSEDMTSITTDYVNNLLDTVSVDLYVVYTNGTIANSTSSGADYVHWVWNTADNLTDYIVYVDATSASLGLVTYRQVLIHFVGVNSPFDLSYLGTFPGGLDAGTIIPVAIILFVAIAFSTITVPLGMFMVVITAAIERYLGWYAITPYGINADLELLAIIGSLVVLYGLYQASRRER